MFQACIGTKSNLENVRDLNHRLVDKEFVIECLLHDLLVYNNLRGT